jgi:hypothetical protein
MDRFLAKLKKTSSFNRIFDFWNLTIYKKNESLSFCENIVALKPLSYIKIIENKTNIKIFHHYFVILIMSLQIYLFFSSREILIILSFLEKKSSHSWIRNAFDLNVSCKNRNILINQVGAMENLDSRKGVRVFLKTQRRSSLFVCLMVTRTI